MTTGWGQILPHERGGMDHGAMFGEGFVKGNTENGVRFCDEAGWGLSRARAGQPWGFAISLSPRTKAEIRTGQLQQQSLRMNPV